MNEFFAALEGAIKKIFDLIAGLISGISGSVGDAQ